MKKYISASLAALIAFTLAFFSGYLGWAWQFSIVGLVFFVLGIFLIRNENSRKENTIKILILITPFIALYGINMFTKNLFHIYPIFFVSLVSVFIAWFLKAHFIKLISPSIIYSTVLLVSGYAVMPNWFNFILDKNTDVSLEFPVIDLVDDEGNIFDIEKDKTYVFDLWSVTCKPCIEKFPDFEKLSLKYKNNPKIEFYTLCLPVKGRNYNDKFTKPYKFKSLYTLDDNSWDMLNVKRVPKYMVVNNKSTIIYKGRLNDKWYHFYNNINTIINDSKIH